MRTIHLALLGLGTVGTGVARILREQARHLESQSGARFAIRWVVVRDPSKPRGIELEDGILTTEVDRAISDPEVDIVVELIGGIDPARDLIARSLRAGKHVVTANKAVLAKHGRELFGVANASGRVIGFEAAVAGGIPIVAAVAQGLAANRISSLAGILNGTSNYILTAMHQQGIGYDEALAEAQRLGFAEADPTLDVDGNDALQKLAILSRLAFQSRVPLEAIRRQGIDTLADVDLHFASELGYVIKLLAVAREVEGKLALRVSPTLVARNHPLGQVHNEYNAIKVTGHAIGDTIYLGKGAGMMPTASSVVADLLDVAIGRAQETFRSLKLWDESPPGPPVSDDGSMPNRFYLRYSIRDEPGTLARIAGILGGHGISIASVIQHETSEDDIGSAVPLIIMTHIAREGAVRTALRETDALDIVRAPTVCLHVAD
ncbi:Homoserine dehydrogenase [Planctomycetes bacterium Pan216]|uniref:Homoserine dehydrogenase n=1 Tax=Kolteria novifilia TaxID=2527975 RepID=A0A518B303_9BACT|nr:Homoserine dehydrogenase [Planctomycetes bacterium Pan216]